MTRDPKITAAAEMVARAMGDNPGFVGRKNVYRCAGTSTDRSNGCGASIVTVDRDAGVTPFLTGCSACKGYAQSSMYRVDQALAPTHEWYRPDTLAGLTPATVDHVLRGGLILRAIVSPAEGA